MVWLYRLALWAILATSTAGMVLSVVRILSDPTWTPLVNATSDEIRAATERALVAAATPENLSAKIKVDLEETPRNWLVLDALHDLATERDIAIPSDLTARFNALRELDHGYLATAESCAACAWDASSCQLSQVVLCQAPIALTPLGDIAGIIHAGISFAYGEEVDRADLALSVIGMGSTAFVIVSGGTSETIKAAAGFAKLARKMGRLSEKLEKMVENTIRTGIDLAKLPEIRSSEDLQAIVRLDVFTPLAETLTDLNRVRSATDTITALYLIKLVDTPDDARKLAIISEALGKNLVGRAEILGKAKLFRTTVRLSRVLWLFFGSFSAFVTSLATIGGHLLKRAVTQILRRELSSGTV